MKIESNENRKKVNKEPGPGKGPDQNTIIGYAIKLMLNILHSQPINTLGNGGRKAIDPPLQHLNIVTRQNVALLLLKNEQGSDRAVASGRENTNNGSPEKA